MSYLETGSRLVHKCVHTADKTGQNCSVSNILRTTENCLRLSPTQFTLPTKQDETVWSCRCRQCELGISVINNAHNENTEQHVHVQNHAKYCIFQTSLYRSQSFHPDDGAGNIWRMRHFRLPSIISCELWQSCWHYHCRYFKTIALNKLITTTTTAHLRSMMIEIEMFDCARFKVRVLRQCQKFQLIKFKSVCLL